MEQWEIIIIGLKRINMKKSKINFIKKAYLDSEKMWLLCKNIFVFNSGDDVLFSEETWVQNRHPELSVNVSLIPEIDELKKEVDEFDSEDLEMLKTYLAETKIDGCSSLIINF